MDKETLILAIMQIIEQSGGDRDKAEAAVKALMADQPKGK